MPDITDQLFVCYKDYGCEGNSEPIIAFKDERDAVLFCSGSRAANGTEIKFKKLSFGELEDG